MPAHSLPSGEPYRRREPEKALLYRTVAAEIDALRAELAAASPYGSGLPKHVDKELEGYLLCGILTHGFARVVCHRCRAEHLVAFSCKGRGLCPSCTARRMHDTAAHLVDRVLPRGPFRQWVATFPRRVRYHLAADPKLATLALREVTRNLFAFQRRRARRLGARPERAHSNGAVTFVQRFNSALELSLHFHILALDGVFVRDEHDLDARPRFVELDPPTNEEVAALLGQIVRRVLALLQRHGRLDDDAADDEPEPHLLLAARPAEKSGQPLVEELLPPLCARQDGFSLHAGIAIYPNDREGLERLARYGLRPPLAQGRLTEAPDGTLRYQMKRRFSDGRHVLVFTPREFLLRLCALVPPRGFHMVRYHGIFAAHARGRHSLTGRGLRDQPAASPVTGPTQARGTPLTNACAGSPRAPAVPPPEAPPSSSKVAGAPHLAPRDHEGPDDPARQRRLAWAVLLRRTWDLDVLACPRCGERMDLIATIEDAKIARKILEHLGLSARAPPRGRPWRPRQQELDQPDRTDEFDGIDPVPVD